MLYIDQLHKSISEDFNDAWLDNFKEPGEFVNSLLMLSGLFENLTDKYYEQINLSVIEGEYIKDNDNINEKIDVIINELNRLGGSELEELSLEENGELFQVIYNNLFFLKYSLERYKGLIGNINRRYNENIRISTLFNYLSNNPELNDNKKNASKNLLLLSNIFQKNLWLTGLDHSLTSDPKTLEIIALLRYELKKIDLNKPYLAFIRQKCEFLFFKIHFRFSQRNERFTGIIDTKNEALDPDDESMSFFKVWVNHIKEHYIDKENYKDISTHYEQNVIKVGHGIPLNYFEFHINTKYYKDVAKDLNRLEKNLLKFRTLTPGNLASNFDKEAYKISENYIANNVFSLRVKDNIKEYKLFEKEIKTLSARGENLMYNFFQLKKSIDILDEYLDGIFNNEELKNENSRELENVSNILDLYSLALEKIEKSITFCKESKYLIYQLPFNECIIKVEINGTVINGFLGSSFVLPIDFKTLNKEVKKQENNYQNYVTQYKVRLSIHSDLIEIKKLRSAVDNTEKRSVEILSIFSAIVLFVAGDIQLFTKITDTQMAIKFMLLFGYVLGSFVLLIWFITRADGFRFKKLSGIHKIILGIFGITTGILIFVMLGLSPQETSNVDKEKKDLKNNIELLQQQIIEKKLQKEMNRLDTVK